MVTTSNFKELVGIVLVLLPPTMIYRQYRSFILISLK